jgi:hypothetical protein
MHCEIVTSIIPIEIFNRNVAFLLKKSEIRILSRVLNSWRDPGSAIIFVIFLFYRLCGRMHVVGLHTDRA